MVQVSWVDLDEEALEALISFFLREINVCQILSNFAPRDRKSVV